MFENVGFETKFGETRQKNSNLDICLTLRSRGFKFGVFFLVIIVTFWL